MTNQYMLGIDIGTQSIRVSLFETNGNSVTFSAAPQYMTSEKPGWATEKPGVWWDCVKENIKNVLKQSGIDPEDIVSIGTGAVMHSPVQISKNGELIADDVQIYSDKRTSGIVENLRGRKDIDLYNGIAANVPAPSWMGLKIKWIKDNMPEAYERTYKFVSAKDYVNYMLTGEMCMDPSEASGAYLMNYENDKWSDELAGLLEIDINKLPGICASSQIIGKVTAKASMETGLKEGTPVACGGGDMLCSLLASGMTRPNIAIDLTGTASVVGFYNPGPIFDKRLMNLRHVMQGWIPYGTVDSSGGAFRWVRDVLCKDEARIARDSQKDEYDYLIELAQSINYGSDGVLFLPYLMGERTMGSQCSKGVFLGMTPDTTSGHLIRAVLEGISFEHKRILDVFEEYTHIDAVLHTAGASKSGFWSQLKADIYQKPVYTLKASETAVLGAALLGAVGVGVYASEIEASEAVVKKDKEYLPDRNKKRRYQELYEVFREIHDSLQTSFLKIANIR